MSQTLRERRALTQRSVRAGIGDLRHLQHARDDSDLGAVAVLAGALAWLAFVALCAVVGVTFADWLSGETLAHFESISTIGGCAR